VGLKLTLITGEVNKNVLLVTTVKYENTVIRLLFFKGGRVFYEKKIITLIYLRSHTMRRLVMIGSTE
jgi:hypothetical protein